MNSRRNRLISTNLFILLAPLCLFSQTPEKYKEKEKSSKEAATVKLRIEVTAGEKDQPVDSASVYVRYEEERSLRKDKKFEMNLKTNRDGVTKVPGVPRGKVLIQVIAQGWKTFGQWYDLEQDEQVIKIKLQKPPKWY